MTPVQDFVDINGDLISVDGSPVSGHPPFLGPHVAPVTANGSDFFTIDGLAVNAMGDADSCGHGRATGSDFVFLED